MAQITHPREVNRIICKFVARCEGRRHSVYDSEVSGYDKYWDVSDTLLHRPNSGTRFHLLYEICLGNPFGIKPVDEIIDMVLFIPFVL